MIILAGQKAERIEALANATGVSAGMILEDMVFGMLQQFESSPEELQDWYFGHWHSIGDVEPPEAYTDRLKTVWERWNAEGASVRPMITDAPQGIPAISAAVAVCKRLVEGWDAEETVWVGCVEDARAVLAAMKDGGSATLDDFAAGVLGLDPKRMQRIRDIEEVVGLEPGEFLDEYLSGFDMYERNAFELAGYLEDGWDLELSHEELRSKAEELVNRWAAEGSVEPIPAEELARIEAMRARVTERVRKTKESKAASKTALVDAAATTLGLDPKMIRRMREIEEAADLEKNSFLDHFVSGFDLYEGSAKELLAMLQEGWTLEDDGGLEEKLDALVQRWAAEDQAAEAELPERTPEEQAEDAARLAKIEDDRVATERARTALPAIGVNQDAKGELWIDGEWYEQASKVLAGTEYGTVEKFLETKLWEKVREMQAANS